MMLPKRVVPMFLEDIDKRVILSMSSDAVVDGKFVGLALDDATRTIDRGTH